MRPLHLWASLMLLAAALLGGAYAAPAPPATPARRLGDLDPTLVNAGSWASSSEPVKAAGRNFFVASTTISGEELYASDGSPDSARLVADLCPGACGSQINYSSFSGLHLPLTVAGSRIFFTANDGLDTELWSFDASATPLRPSKLDLSPGPDSSAFRALVSFGGKVAAIVAHGEIASNTSMNEELVITDGSVGGTARYDLNPGPGSSAPRSLTVAGDRLFFTAEDGVHGRELWVTTGAQPAMLELNPHGSGLYTDEPMVAVGLRVIFAASDGVAGRRLGASDGSSVTFFDLEPRGNGSSTYPQLVATANLAFFFTQTAEHGFELGVTDGLSAAVLDATPGPDDSLTAGSALAATSTRAYFSAPGANSTRIGTSDGVAVSMYELNTAGVSYGITRWGVTTPSRAFFATFTGSRYDLWATDGGPPARLTDGFELNPDQLRVVASGERVLFIPAGAPGGSNLATTDGQGVTFATLASTNGATPYAFGLGDGSFLIQLDDGARGTEPYLLATSLTALGDLEPARNADTRWFTALATAAERILLMAWTSADGQEPWVSDGTPEGTLLMELFPGPAGVGSYKHVLIGTRVFLFTFDPPQPNLRLWSIDLAAATPRPTAISLGASSAYSLSSVAAAGGRLFFSTYDPAQSGQLWMLDTLREGASPQRIDGADRGLEHPGELTAFGDGVFFGAETNQGRELVFANGIELKIFDLNPGPASSNPRAMKVANGKLYLIGSSSAVGTEPGLSDGVTAALIDLTPEGSSYIQSDSLLAQFTPVGQAVCFNTSYPLDRFSWGYRLACVSDGQSRRFPESITPIFNDASTAAKPFTSATRAYVEVATAATGREPAFTDGAELRILDLVPGPAGSDPQLITVVGDRFLLSVQTPERGREPLLTDGSEAGTTYFDLEPGAAGSQPDTGLSIAQRALLRVATSAFGREPAALVGDEIQVLDVNPGPASSLPAFEPPLRGRREALFCASSAGHGRELWASDGTAATTRLLYEFGPGERSGCSSWEGMVENNAPPPPIPAQVGVGSSAWLLIAADDGTGRNPWAVSLAGFSRDGTWLPLLRR